MLARDQHRCRFFNWIKQRPRKPFIPEKPYKLTSHVTGENLLSECVKEVEKLALTFVYRKERWCPVVEVVASEVQLVAVAPEHLHVAVVSRVDQYQLPVIRQPEMRLDVRRLEAAVEVENLFTMCRSRGSDQGFLNP